MDSGIESPQESLVVIRRTLDLTRRRLMVPEGPVYKVWGVVVLIGHAGTLILFRLQPPEVAGPLTGLLWTAMAVPAAVFTAWYHLRHATSPESGVSSPLASRLGLMWTLGLVIPVLTGVVVGLPDYQLSAIGASAIAFLNIVEGLVFFNPVALGLGLWLAVVNIAGLTLGREGHLLVMAVLAGGALIVAGFLEDRRHASTSATGSTSTGPNTSPSRGAEA